MVLHFTFPIFSILHISSIKYNLSSKNVYSLFKANDIVKYYNICHTFDIVDAAERMMESIKYDNSSVEEKSYKSMKRLMYTDKLSKYLNKDIKVFVDRPIGYNHHGVLYTQNYGYIKEFKALDNEYQDAYIIGVNKPIDYFEGKIIAIINRTNDIEDKLVVCDKNKNYTKDEIKKLVEFQEKYFKSKIII